MTKSMDSTQSAQSQTFNPISLKEHATELHKLLSLIKQHTDVDFSCYKHNTLFRRIQRRLTALQIDTLSTYIYYLHQHPSEIKILFNELLINVTHFFRDAEAFEQLKKVLLKKLPIEHFKDNCFRVWVPACSTGEEAYSIAIIIQECLNLLKMDVNVRIFGTDADLNAIETARLGVYSSHIEKHVSAERLRQFFIKENGGYKVDSHLRKMVIFSKQNIIADPPFSKLHLLSCRNLLIYLEPKLQNKVLSLFNFSLNKHGLLFIGSSESLNDSIEHYDTINKKCKIYEQKNNITDQQLNVKIATAAPLPKPQDVTRIKKMTKKDENTLDNFIKDAVIESLTPACVVIDDQGDIIYSYGPVSKFLEFVSGKTQLHLIDMVPVDLRPRFQLTIEKVIAEQKEMTLHQILLKKYDEIKYVNVKMKPIIQSELSDLKPSVLIIIEEILFSEHARQTHQNFQDHKNKSDHVLQVNNELSYTKNNLQIAIEELQSTNEELQSTNEELQSLNEEVTTVNSELENRIEQLSTANDDIKNILDNTEIATIVLDKNLCIKRFTPKATELVNLIPTDIGRPIQHIVFNIQPSEKIIDDARTVLKTLEPIHSEGVNKDGHWYVIRIIPYRASTHLAYGVIIIFLDTHIQNQLSNKQKILDANLESIKQFNDALLNNISESAVILDDNLKIKLANEHFMTQFNLNHNDVIGHQFDELTLNGETKRIKKWIELALEKKSLSSELTFHIKPLQKLVEANASPKIMHLTLYKISTSMLLLTLKLC